MDVWADVAARRSQLAEWARSLEPSAADAPSWCDGWRVRDVLGHLVHLAEATQLRMARDVITRGPMPDRALARVAADLGRRSVEELSDRLQAAAGGRFHILGTPMVVALGEVLVHGSDMLRAVGADDEVDPSIVVPVLNIYRRVGRLAFHAAPAAKVTLVATDVQAAIGQGPEVRGRALDLLLLLANRRQVLADLVGPGLDNIRG
ncbi:MAG: maleylpyruvate isomerase family mycothiol-dependent enzyme [Acidimicrobiales bacterium]